MFKALNTDDLVGLKQSTPTILLDTTLDMSAPDIWRLVMCNRDFHKTFLNLKGCTNVKLGPWMLLKDGAELYEAGQLELLGLAAPTDAPMICGARRRVEYDGPSNSQSLGTKTVKYVENQTCYTRPNAGMLVHVRTNMLKVMWMKQCIIKDPLTMQITQGMKKSFLPYNQLLLDRVHGQKRHDGQAIPMEGIGSCVKKTWTSFGKWMVEQCVRAIYGADAILPLSVYIVGAALVFLVPTKVSPKEIDSSGVHNLPT
ncbi:hypothetical protein COCOBI_18-2390 [Coccomyxa sp. Obi]|nr:hypothetical protein COCOBI_18-2390 [Coccomyxa sp. Obi]